MHMQVAFMYHFKYNRKETKDEGNIYNEEILVKSCTGIGVGRRFAVFLPTDRLQGGNQ